MALLLKWQIPARSPAFLSKELSFVGSDSSATLPLLFQNYKAMVSKLLLSVPLVQCRAMGARGGLRGRRRLCLSTATDVSPVRAIALSS